MPCRTLQDRQDQQAARSLLPRFVLDLPGQNSPLLRSVLVLAAWWHCCLQVYAPPPGRALWGHQIRSHCLPAVTAALHRCPACTSGSPMAAVAPFSRLHSHSMWRAAGPGRRAWIAECWAPGTSPDLSLHQPQGRTPPCPSCPSLYLHGASYPEDLWAGCCLLLSSISHINDTLSARHSPHVGHPERLTRS